MFMSVVYIIIFKGGVVRKIALLMSVLALSGCVLTDLGSGKFFGRSSSSAQMAASPQANEMLERVMLSCNNGGDSDFSEIFSLLKQQEYQQASTEHWGNSVTYFYNSPKPLYFLGYPVLYFSLVAGYGDVSIGLPPEAYARIKSYDGRRAEGKKDEDGNPRSLYWRVYRTDMEGGYVHDEDATSSVKYTVLECY